MAMASVSCLFEILCDAPQIVIEDPAEHDRRADERKPAEHLPVEYRDQDGVEDGLQRIDDGSRDRIGIFGARREEDIGKTDLDSAQKKDGEQHRRREHVLPEDQRREKDAARELAEEHRRESVALLKAVEHKDTRIEDAGQQGQQVTQPLARGEPLKEEAQNTRKDDQDGDQSGPRRFLSEEQEHQDHDPDRCGVLKDDRVAGRGQLVGNRVQGRHARHGNGADEHGRIEAELMLGGQNIEPDHDRRDHVAGSVDRKRIPGDQLHEQAAGRKAERGGEHAHGAERFFVCLSDCFLHNDVTITQALAI